MNSETGPIRLVSWTPYISSSGANLEGGRGEFYRGKPRVGGEFYRGLPRGDFYRGLFKAFRRGGHINSETGPIYIDMSLGPHISVLQGLTQRVGESSIGAYLEGDTSTGAHSKHSDGGGR